MFFSGSIIYNLPYQFWLGWMFCLHFSYQPETTIMIAMFSWTASNIHNASWKDQILSFYIEQQIQESYPDENAVLMFEKCSLERICKCKSFISMQFPLLPHQLKNSEGNKDIQKKKSLSSQTSPYNPHTFISLSKWGQILFTIISDWYKKKITHLEISGGFGGASAACGFMQQVWRGRQSRKPGETRYRWFGWLLWGFVVIPQYFQAGRILTAEDVEKEEDWQQVQKGEESLVVV